MSVDFKEVLENQIVMLAGINKKMGNMLLEAEFVDLEQDVEINKMVRENSIVIAGLVETCIGYFGSDEEE